MRPNQRTALSNPFSDAAFAARSLLEAAQGAVRPRLRIGVTGLARSGKTVFTTALVHHLMTRERLPVFSAAAEGRIARVSLSPQPDDDVPRFPVESHLAGLRGPERRWPESTSRISELRLVIDHERRTGWLKGPSSLILDVVDYPGEWLLDLALIGQTYRDWSAEVLRIGDRGHRATLGAEWRALLATLDADAPADEAVAERAAQAFRAFLRAVRDNPEAVATIPPGRFLMPGDLEGSPALTFAPLKLAPDRPDFAAGTLGELMARRFRAYQTRVAEPFFTEHFARLDRQIVLVDVLSALDGGPHALADLEDALDRVLQSFRVGRNSWATRLFAPRIDRVLFAATKADHLHHSQHDRLEAILKYLVARALRRTEGAGGAVKTVALAAVRATREVSVSDGGRSLPAVVGVPVAGERIGDDVFDGLTEAAIYPGELPPDPTTIFSGAIAEGSLRFPRVRPPLPGIDAAGREQPMPHIRLDRALEFLIGDRLA